MGVQVPLGLPRCGVVAVPVAEKLKLWAAALITLSAVYAVFYKMDDSAALLRAGAMILALVASSLLVIFSEPGRVFFGFARDSGVELRKVVWPGKDETLRLTGIVLALVAAITLFLWLVDYILSTTLEFLAG